MNRHNNERRVRRPTLPAEVFTALHRLLDHVWADEERQFWNATPKEREGHLFGSLSLLRQWLALPTRRSKRGKEGS
jgi:hypothetical protein